MNIAFLTPAFDPRQHEANVITIRSLAAYLQSAGHRVIIIQNRESGLARGEMTDQGVCIERPYAFFNFSIGKGFNPLHFFDLVIAHALGVRWVEKKYRMQFDVLHSFSAAPLLMYRALLAQIVLRRRMPLIHSFKSISQYRVGGYFPRRAARSFHTLTVQTEYQFEYLVKRGVARDRIWLVPSHINTDKFKPRDRNALKKKYGFDGQYIVLYYGHFLEVKGVEYLIRAVPQLRASTRQPFRVLLAWSGLGPSDTYDRLIAQLGVYDNIQVLKDTKKPVEEYVSMADVVVLPYPHLKATEANPSCILESMASQTLVVTTDLEELPRFLQSGKNILKVPPRDHSSLSAVLSSLIGQKKHVQEIVDQAYAESHQFSLSEVGNTYSELYEKAISGNLRH